MPDPEQLARQEIDALLSPCGWVIQDKSAVNLAASRGVAEVERRMSVVEELESAVKANIQRGARLRKSILQNAFAGELT